MLIHGFSLVNARLLKAFGTAFYAITIFIPLTEDRKNLSMSSNSNPDVALIVPVFTNGYTLQQNFSGSNTDSTTVSNSFLSP